VETRTAPGLSGRRILVIEDDPSRAGRLAGTLEAGGATVVGPVSLIGDAMVLLQSEQPPDLAILDVELGWSTVSPLVAALRSLRIPVVCSGATAGWDLGEGCWAVPPFQGPEGQDALLRALAALIGEPGWGPALWPAEAAATGAAGRASPLPGREATRRVH
jgi:CheY-like chemotaxis protein